MNSIPNEPKFGSTFELTMAVWALAIVFILGSPISSHAESREPLLASQLKAAGFKSIGKWQLKEDGNLQTVQQVPSAEGVYAFSEEGTILYVGLAKMGLAKRLYFYANPGTSQSTNNRVNILIRRELKAGRSIEILAASPPDLIWNGLPVEGNAGLELGLIENYVLPWNIRGINSKE